MFVKHIEITPEQQTAAVSAMRGKFRLTDVRRALMAAGVPYDDWIADRAADRLLQRERKAGRIRAVHNKLWEAC